MRYVKQEVSYFQFPSTLLQNYHLSLTQARTIPQFSSQKSPPRCTAVHIHNSHRQQSRQTRNLGNAFRSSDGVPPDSTRDCGTNRFVKRTLNNWPICAQEAAGSQAGRSATSSIYNNTVDGFIKSERRRRQWNHVGRGRDLKFPDIALAIMSVLIMRISFKGESTGDTQL